MPRKLLDLAGPPRGWARRGRSTARRPESASPGPSSRRSSERRARRRLGTAVDDDHDARPRSRIAEAPACGQDHAAALAKRARSGSRPVEARRRDAVVRHEEVRRRGCWVGSTRYLSKSVTPSAARKVSSIRKLPLNSRDGFWKIAIAASATISGSRLARIIVVAAEQVLHGRRRDGGARPQRVHRDALPAQFAREPQHAQAHAELGHRVGADAARTTSPACRAAATASGCAGSPPWRDRASRISRP